MRTPLINQKTNFLPSYLLTFGLSLLGLFLLHVIVSNNQQNDPEISLGTEPTWRDILDTYWAVGTLPARMKDEMPFHGQRDPKISMTRCKNGIPPKPCEQ